jgi:hypothetical protein
MAGQTCNRTGCHRDAEYRIGLKVFPRRGNVPAEGWTGLVVCNDCRALVTVEEIVTDEMWRRLTASFGRLAKASPLRSRTQLQFQALGSANDDKTLETFHRMGGKNA